jgi:hypothetical protein
MRKSLATSCLLIAACGAAVAQGTFRFTWHGDLNAFSASFLVTEAEMQPGGHFNSQLFHDSIAVDSLSGIHYSYGGSGIANGDAQPFAISIDLFNFDTGTEVYLSGNYDFQGLIDEKPFSGPHLFIETGHWTYAAVPEPSLGCFTVAAAALWPWRRQRMIRC